MKLTDRLDYALLLRMRNQFQTQEKTIPGNHDHGSPPAAKRDLFHAPVNFMCLFMEMTDEPVQKLR